MADPFIGEMKIIAYKYAPQGWALCDGALMDISQNPALYSLIQIQFGGNGTTNFNLPDMRGRIPVHPYSMYYQGSMHGFETVTLQEANLPQHAHQIKASSEPADAKIANDANDMFAVSQSAIYNSPSNLVELHSSAFTYTGEIGAHTNIQPSLVLKFVIALIGTYPQRS